MHSVLRRSPGIIAVGNSRVLEFTADFFAPGSFFNAGRVTRKIKHFRAFLDAIPLGKEPRVLLIGLDQVLFGESVDDLDYDNFDQDIRRSEDPLAIYLDQWQNIWKEYLWKGKFTLRQLVQRDNIVRIGVGALLSDNGFQSDGSYHYGIFLNSEANQPKGRFRFAKALEWVKDHNQEHFPAVDYINESAVKEFDLFLKESNRRGIYVVGFLPPFAPTVYRSLLADTSRFPYIFKLSQTLQPIFKEHGFGFFDFSDPATISSPDAEFMDGNHGLQKTYLRILITIAETDKKLQQFTNTDRLKSALRRSSNDFTVQLKD